MSHDRGQGSRRPSSTYPFSAIVGQETLKLALLLNAVDPRVGGVLIKGEKGTAKSTAVRALAAVLPEVDVISDCRYGCDPGEPVSWCDECRERREKGKLPKESRRPRIIELPVSATEDRLVGTLDFEAALKKGERSFHPGLLADANRGVLYVDEVNLLDDHLVDTLLDAAAMGVNTVEREGVSHVHPARFMLVGTMNPEEGEIRPQLLDRFGLCVEVRAVQNVEARVEIVRRRQAFEEDSHGFCGRWTDTEDELRNRLKHARLRLSTVKLHDEILYAIADLAVRAGVDGHRADSVMARAASALAAYEGRSETTLADVEQVAPLVLAHRLRRVPFEQVGTDAETMRTSLMRALSGPEDDSGRSAATAPAAPGQGQASIFDSLGATVAGAADAEQVDASLQSAMDRTRRSIAGKRQETVSSDGRGRYRGSEPARGSTSASDVALDATIRTAAGNSAGRAGANGMAMRVEAEDVRRKVRVRRVGATIVFCVDASGSMGASKRISAAKAAVLNLLVDAYQRRDRVALISFRGEKAEVVLSPTSSVELANLRLRELPTGGATPLAHGIVSALEVVDAEMRREPDTVPWIILVTDGRGNVGLDGGLGSEDARTAAARVRSVGIHAIVIDTASSPGPESAARDLARAAGAEYLRLSALDGDGLVKTLRERI